jgi:hypothetical protein
MNVLVPVTARSGGMVIAAASIDHLRRYIRLLFHPAMQKSKEMS